MKNDHSTIDINSKASIYSMIYLAVVGVCVFIIQPGIVQGFVDKLHFTPEQAGYITSAEMWGLAATTILLAFIADKINWQSATRVCLLIAVVGNALSINQTDLETLAVIRVVTGFGLGGMITLPFAMLGLTEKTDRNFAMTIVWVLIYGAIGLFLIPFALENIGMNGIFIFLAIFCAIGLLLIRYLPVSATSHEQTTPISSQPNVFAKTTALLATLTFNIAIGAVWTYLFLVGTSAEINEQSVANILTISQFAGIVGAFLAGLLASKIFRGISLSISILFCGAGIGLLLGDVNLLIYSAAIYIFNFFWNIAQPYLLGTLAAFNDGSRTVVRGSCMQMIGFAIGPYLAASLLGSGALPDYDAVNRVGVILFLISAILFIPALRSTRYEKREQNEVVADITT